MFGAIFGDIIGSYYELHCTKEHDFPLRRECTFTDDSVMTAAVCRAILLNDSPINKHQLKQRAKEFAVQYKQFYSYFPNAGYGYLFSKWASDVKNMRIQRSYGNGAAMRVQYLSATHMKALNRFFFRLRQAVCIRITAVKP